MYFFKQKRNITFSRNSIGEGNGNPLQCSCLENPRDGGTWWAADYGVAQSRTRLKRLSSSSSRNSIISDKQPCNDFSKYSEFFSMLENKNICRHYKLWAEFIYCLSYCPRGKKNVKTSLRPCVQVSQPCNTHVHTYNFQHQ